MSSGISVVHYAGCHPFLCFFFPPPSFFFSAGCHPASPSSIAPHVMRHVLCPLYGILSPYARWSDSRRYSAEFFSSFFFLSFDISICRISLSRNLRCPARPALSCAREFRERSSLLLLLLLWARGVGGLPLRWSLSTSGRVILYRARLYCINAEPRPIQDKCGRSPCGARMSILADSIRLSQGCLPTVLFRFSVYAPHIYVRHIFFS